MNVSSLDVTSSIAGRRHRRRRGAARYALRWMKRFAIGSGLVAWLAACGSASSGGAAPGTTDAGVAADGAAQSPSEAGAPPAGAGCTVVSKGTSGIALKATLLLPAGPMDGEVLVDGTGKITCAAASCASAPGHASATQITCSNAVVSPGLVNAHDHTDYDFQPPVHIGTTRYQHRDEWRTGADGMPPLTPSPTYSDDAPTNASIELRFLMSGVTTIVGSGGIGGLVRNLSLNPYTNASFEGLAGKSVNFDVFPLGDQNGTILDSGCNYPSVVSPASAFSAGIFAPHFAEGINVGAENEIVCATGMLGLVTAQTTVLHAVGTNARDVAAIQAAGAKVVWAPRSNIALYGDTMPITEMKYAGVPISLGTDWLPTGSMNMLRELACADALNAKYYGGAFDDAELVAMATSNGATAMGFGDQIGTIATGMVGDLVVYAAGTGTTGTKGWRTVIEAADEDVTLVLRGGTPLYGDAALVKAVSSAACGTMDVCGTTKAACIDVPNVTVADVQKIASSTYPLFFCRGQTPTDEPTCLPYRDAYPNGTSATDRDGDGIADTTDDCPAVFNPPRTMDKSVQSDLDGDGFGDACDAKPLDASAH